MCHHFKKFSIFRLGAKYILPSPPPLRAYKEYLGTSLVRRTYYIVSYCFRFTGPCDFRVKKKRKTRIKTHLGCEDFRPRAELNKYVFVRFKKVFKAVVLNSAFKAVVLNSADAIEIKKKNQQQHWQGRKVIVRGLSTCRRSFFDSVFFGTSSSQ